MINRRSFLKLIGAGAGAGLGLPRLAEALAAPDLPDLLRSPASAAERDPIAHALNRVGFGAVPGQVAAVREMGLDEYIDQQLDPDSIDDRASERRLGNLITLDLMPDEMTRLGKTPLEVVQELLAATLLRAVYSKRQLFEVMVNFWSEHFSIFHRKGICSVLKTVDDRDVIRKHALGKFRDLLGASAHSPAMLFYLDNAGSEKEHPNENYAREVMELHTITVGNYTEQDVKELARILTGWTIRPRRGEFEFDKAVHDTGAKTFLGERFPGGGGEAEGERALDMLAAHPATAQHISSKLCRRFIADDPPQALVDAVAAEFTRTEGDIRAVLRVIFKSPEFLNAPPKFKRPFELVVGTLRNLGAEMQARQARAYFLALREMGHMPFDWPTPDGYTDYAQSWIGNMLLRWNFAINVVTGKTGNIKVDLPGILRKQNVQIEPEAALRFFAEHLLGRPLTEAEALPIWEYMRETGSADFNSNQGRRTLTEAVSVMLASPAYQYR